MSNVQYFLTYHAIERFQERFPEAIKDNNTVKNWKRPTDVNCIKHFFDDLLNESKENRSYFNNTKYMVNMYETYGYETEYKFFENLKLGVLFVIAKERNESHYRLVTVMPTEFKKKFALNHIKYNEKEKKEEKHQKKLLEIYDHFQQSTLTFENKNLSTIDRLTELEKQDNFTILYSQHLSEFLNDLTKLLQQKNKKGTILEFKSKHYSYTFIKPQDDIKLVEYKKLTANEIIIQQQHYQLMDELYARMEKSQLKQQFNRYVSLRIIVANYVRYNVKFYEKLNEIEIVNSETLNQEDLLEYCASIDIDVHIKQKIDKGFYICVDKDNYIYITQIDDNIFTFKYDKTSNEIEFLTVDSLFTLGLNMNHMQLKEKLLHMIANNQIELIESLNSRKKIKQAFLENKLVKFLQFIRAKEIMIIDIKQGENIEELDYLDEKTEINNAFLEKYKELTKTLIPEEELFLKRFACEDNTIRKISNRKSIHKIAYNRYNYEFLLHNVHNEGYVITLLKKEA